MGQRLDFNVMSPLKEFRRNAGSPLKLKDFSFSPLKTRKEPVESDLQDGLKIKPIVQNQDNGDSVETRAEHDATRDGNLKNIS